jgi:RNA polymerase sigma factor (sigma-70 family)
MNHSAATKGFLVDAEIVAVPAPRTAEDVATSVLTKRLVAGDEVAWREFHDVYFDRLLRYLLVVCHGDENASREALQTALVKIVRTVRTFYREDVFWSWLSVVARSCGIDHARRQSRYRSLIQRYSGLVVKPATDDSLIRLLDECLAALPEAERALVQAKYRDRRTSAELAADAGCSIKALEARLARVRQRVKTNLLQRLRDEN